MATNLKFRYGSPTGPLVQLVEIKGGTAYFLSAEKLEEGTNLYYENGNFAFVLGQHRPSEIATFYESRSEQQALTEDGPTGVGGWISKHLGWTVNFERGIALYGELASLNQNRQNVGIEGPTDVTGTNGSPAILTQNVTVTNRPEQVNGWKSYDSPNAYLLDPSDVQQLDTTYVYADAFVSWSADSNVVATPGSDLNNLVEYPPANSIRYTT